MKSNDIDNIFNLLMNKKDLLLTGGAGVGKTYTVQKLIEKLKENRIEHAVCASTGIAARNLDERAGTTIHYFLGTKNLCHKKQIKQCRNDSSIKKRISKTKVLIIDEISMISKSQYELYDEILKMNNFRGAILFVGDFLQLPPIETTEFKECNNKYIFTSNLFSPKVISLDVSKRSDNKEFNIFLNQIRIGNINDLTIKYLKKFERKPDDKSMSNFTCLYAINEDADKHNEKMLARLKSEEIEYNGIFEGEEKYKKDLLKSILAPEKFKFKIGAKVMLIRNIDNRKNGEIGEIIDFHNGNKAVISIKFNDGEFAYYGPYKFIHEEYNEDYSKKTILASFSQFPFRLAYAITVHKSQGLSIDKLFINNVGNFFAEGQFYVALSRASNTENLFISDFTRNGIQTSLVAKEYYDNGCKFKCVEKANNSLFSIIERFIKQEDYNTNYLNKESNIEFKATSAIRKTNISYLAFLANDNEVSNGIYPAIYHYHFCRKVFVVFGQSKNEPIKNWGILEFEYIQENLLEDELEKVKKWKYNYLDNYFIKCFNYDFEDINSLIEELSIELKKVFEKYSELYSKLDISTFTQYKKEDTFKIPSKEFLVKNIDKKKILLSEEQQKIVNLNQGQHLVLAPPGTGKTELLVQRLSNAVKNGTKEDKMICLTFTNRAAKNMIDRVEKEIGEHKIFIGNIHNFCNTFLRKNRVIPQSTSLLDEEDVEILFKELKQDLKSFVIDRYNDKERYISTNELLNLNTFLKQKEMAFSKDITQDLVINFRTTTKNSQYEYINDVFSKSNAIEICKRYEQIKKESNFIDFDDLLTLTYGYLNNDVKHETVFEWLQIDEVQDLNPLQWAIVNKISNQRSHRVFFGDYEQAIFSFMGAKLEVLDRVAEESEVHNLQNNFRSPQYLLDLYNVYAKYWLNPKWKHEPKSLNRLEKTRDSLVYKEIKIPHEIKKMDKYDNEFYSIARYSTEDEEISWIIEKKLPKEPKENTAILVRTNMTADKFANEFNKRGVKYFKISGFDLFRRKIIKDLMAFFNIIVNNQDRNSWIRNFHLYGQIKTLKKSRSFINYMFSIGINPLDFIRENIKVSYLDDFLLNFHNKRMVVFDTETTGLDTDNDDIIQIAAVEIINGKFGEVFEVFINTDKDLRASEKIHHISKEYLNEFAVNKKEALLGFLNFIDDSVVVAHNLKYDYDILNSNLKRCGLNQLQGILKYDSIEIAKRIYPTFPSYKLEYLLDRLKIEGENSHNALDDVKATVNLILSLEGLIQDSKKRREDFIGKNGKTIKNFQDKFTPVYEAISGKFSDHLPIDEVVGMVISYMSDRLKYDMEDDIYDEIDKLLRHMKFKCRIDKVITNIKNYIPEYVKYKESDLVIGNEKIIIATIHKAKGLEFENVIIPGCTDNNYPSYYSKKNGEQSVVEDARLLYVAMTRVKKRLLITSHTRKNLRYKIINQSKSRFLEPVLNMFE